MVDHAPLWMLFLISAILTLVAVEIGFVVGRRRGRSRDRETDAPVGAMTGATLGLGAFILAFTFSMAGARYDVRKQLVLDEANAIGTAYLRTDLMPDDAAAQARASLREYVAIRLDAAAHPSHLDSAIAKSESLQQQLWKQAAAMGKSQPDSVSGGLYIQAVNDVFDLQTKRIAAFRNRIPDVIWGFAYLVMVMGMVSIGYQTGLGSGRRSWATLFLTIAFSGVMMLVADLDRPRQGLVTVSQQAMADLHKSMQADETPAR